MEAETKRAKFKAAPRARIKGQFWSGRMAPPNHGRRLLVLLPKGVVRVRRGGIDRHRTRPAIKAARAPHQHDWVAVTGPDKADGSVDVTIVCAVPGYRCAP